MPGGILWDRDWPDLIESIDMVLADFPMRARFVELGVDDQRTSIDLYNYIKPRISDFYYVGVDIKDTPHVKPEYIGDRYIYLSGVSFLKAKDIYWDCQWVLIDACHCAACVTKDIEAHIGMLSRNGLMLFHDASPMMQWRDPQNYPGDHHDQTEAAKGIAVRQVLDEPGFCHRYGLELVKAAPEHQQFGGVEIYRKR